MALSARGQSPQFGKGNYGLAVTYDTTDGVAPDRLRSVVVTANINDEASCMQEGVYGLQVRSLSRQSPWSVSARSGSSVEGANIADWSVSASLGPGSLSSAVEFADVVPYLEQGRSIIGAAKHHYPVAYLQEPII